LVKKIETHQLVQAKPTTQHHIAAHKATLLPIAALLRTQTACTVWNVTPLELSPMTIDCDHQSVIANKRYDSHQQHACHEAQSMMALLLVGCRWVDNNSRDFQPTLAKQKHHNLLSGNSLLTETGNTLHPVLVEQSQAESSYR
jgi:hypothetical protein